MKRINPNQKFFTEDLYVDLDETGNAFHGYHLANNFGRLLGLGGTAYFSELSSFPFFQPRTVDFPIDKLQFIHAPVVQLWSVEDNYAISTVYTKATFSGGSMQNDYLLPPLSRTLIYHSVWTNDAAFSPLEAVAGEYLKIGDTSNELMEIIGFGQTRIDHITTNPRYEWSRSYIAYRQSLDTIAESYLAGANVYHVGANGTTGNGLAWPWPNSGNKSWGREIDILGSSLQTQPIWVEAYMDFAKLRVRWLLPRAGTVIFRIFGV